MSEDMPLPMLLPQWFTPPLPTTPQLLPTPPLLTMLPRSTLTRSPPTHTTMPSLTTTPTPTSTLLSLVTEPARLKALTPWLFLTAGSSMSTTTPTTTTATWLRSPMTALLSIPMLPSLLLLATTLPLLSTLPLLFTLPLLTTLPLLFTLLLLSTLPLLFTLLLLSTLPTLLLSTVVQARALTSPSRSLTRERRGPPARPRLSDPRSPLYPRLIPSVTRLSPVWLSISDRDVK